MGSSSSYAQQSVTIGGTDLKDNAILWLNGSGSQGLLLPTVSTTNDVSGPDAGLVVFQNSDSRVYYFNGSAWIGLGAEVSEVVMPTAYDYKVAIWNF